MVARLGQRGRSCVGLVCVATAALVVLAAGASGSALEREGQAASNAAAADTGLNVSDARRKHARSMPRLKRRVRRQRLHMGPLLARHRPRTGIEFNISLLLSKRRSALTPFPQDVGYGNGHLWSAGLFHQTPIAQIPNLGDVSLRLGADAVGISQDPNNLGNLLIGGQTPISGHRRIIGGVPNIGVVVTLPSGVDVSGDVGYGWGSDDWALNQAGNVSSGGAGTGIFRLRGRMTVPVMQDVRVGLIGGYIRTDGSDGRTPTGVPFSLQGIESAYLGFAFDYTFGTSDRGAGRAIERFR